MEYLRLAVFVPTFILLLKFVGFDKFDRRSASARVFFCLLVATLVAGGIDWMGFYAFGWNLN